MLPNSTLTETNKGAMHVFLSPHLDDVALSCGGTVAQLARAGYRVLVVTVFAGSPPPDLGRFGERHVRLWGGAEDPMRRRRAEDEAAMDILGATPVYGLYPDAPFRRHPVEGRWLYTSDRLLFGMPDPSEGDFPHRIAGEVLTLLAGHRARIYAPLAVGRHVDHVILASAGHLLQREGYDVVWYEDFPYAERALRPDVLAARGWHAALVPLDEEDVQRKMRAVLCYRSQIPSLFGNERHARRRLLDYMLTTSGLGYPAERYWTRQTT